MHFANLFCGETPAETVLHGADFGAMFVDPIGDGFVNLFCGISAAEAPQSRSGRLSGVARSGMKRNSDDGGVSAERVLRRRVRAAIGTSNPAWNVGRCDAAIMRGETDVARIISMLVSAVSDHATA